MATLSYAHVGQAVREWRERRRLSQLDLALEAGISTRHLSFVETGRSKPGRDLLLRVTEQLEMPFRDRNQLLLTAGHAPAFPEHSLDDPELAPVREALEMILIHHEPYPAIVVDRSWNLVAANAGVAALAEGVQVDPELLQPPINALRAGLNPRGLGSRVINLDDWIAHFRERLQRQAATTADAALQDLIEEISSYATARAAPTTGPIASPRPTLGPLRLWSPNGQELSFMGMFASFDTPFEVTTSELAIEMLFPTDQTTAEAMTRLHSIRPDHQSQDARSS